MADATSAAVDLVAHEMKPGSEETVSASSNNLDGGFTCGDCMMMFPSLEGRDLHMETHHQVNHADRLWCHTCANWAYSLNCTACRIRVSAAHMLTFHQHSNHTKAVTEERTEVRCKLDTGCFANDCKICDNCLVKPKRRSLVAGSGKPCSRKQCSNPIDGIFTCGECAAYFVSRPSLTGHMRIHQRHPDHCSAPTPYCACCKREFASVNSFEAHWDIAHAGVIVYTASQKQTSNRLPYRMKKGGNKPSDQSCEGDTAKGSVLLCNTLELPNFRLISKTYKSHNNSVATKELSGGTPILHANGTGSETSEADSTDKDNFNRNVFRSKICNVSGLGFSTGATESPSSIDFDDLGGVQSSSCRSDTRSGPARRSDTGNGLADLRQQIVAESEHTTGDGVDQSERCHWTANETKVIPKPGMAETNLSTNEVEKRPRRGESAIESSYKSESDEETALVDEVCSDQQPLEMTCEVSEESSTIIKVEENFSEDLCS